jgi:hypothetical protein
MAPGSFKNEGLWLNDKNAVIGLSRLNPLPKNSAVNNSLAKGLEEKAKPMPGVAPPRRTPLFHSETVVGNWSAFPHNEILITIP